MAINELKRDLIAPLNTNNESENLQNLAYTHYVLYSVHVYVSKFKHTARINFQDKRISQYTLLYKST